MTGIEWFGDPRPALMRMPKIGGHAMRGIGGGIAGAALIAAAAFAWNAYSNAGLIRALGGVTPQQVSDAIAGHPGPPGPQGPPGPAGPVGPPATVAAAAMPAPVVPIVRLVPQTDANYEKTGPIPHSEAYPVCTLSKVSLRHEGKNADGSCQLKRGGHAGGPWEVVVNSASCSVTCFSLSTNR